MEVYQKTEDSFKPIVIGDYFNIGKIYHKTLDISKFRLTSRTKVTDKLISYFTNYSLLGYKRLRRDILLKSAYAF